MAMDDALKKTTLESWVAGLSGVSDGQKPTHRLAKVSATNTEIVRQLLEIAKKANESGQKSIANNIMESIRQLLDNNKDLQEVVIEIKPRLD